MNKETTESAAQADLVSAQDAVRSTSSDPAKLVAPLPSAGPAVRSSSSDPAKLVAPSAVRSTDIVEAILFASQKPVSIKEFRAIFKGAGLEEDETARAYARIREAELLEALSALAIAIQDRSATYELRETSLGWQLVTRRDYAPWMRQLYPENRPTRISAPAMETLAIIAYRQPITRADIEAVRGVSVDGVMQTLLDRGLIRIGGRAEVPGRPLLYETTHFFMDHFGLRDLDELPNADELRKVVLPAAAPEPELPFATDAAPADAVRADAATADMPTAGVSAPDATETTEAPDVLSTS